MFTKFPLFSFSNFVCQSSNVRLGQFGVYDLVVPDASGSGSSLPECDFRTALDPVDANIAILYCALILIAIGIVYQVTIFNSDDSKKLDHFTND